MELAIDIHPVTEAQPQRAVLARAEYWNVTQRMGALVTLLGLSAGPGAGASDGPLASWGRNIEDQVSATPLGTFRSVAGGGFHSVAIKTDGSLVAWGNNGFGQAFPTPPGTFTAVAAGTLHNVAIKTDGSLVSWGYDGYAQVFDTPTAGTYAAAAAGGFHSVAVQSDGSLVSWGNNLYSQVSATPAGTFTAVAAGYYHSVAIATDGSLVAWGVNDFGVDDFGQVRDLPSVGAFTAVASGYYHSVAIRADGTLVSWGADDFGQVSATPLGTFTAVAAGDSHSVAIRTDGTLVSWGVDNFDQVSGTPAGNFTSVAAGGFHSVAIGMVDPGANRSPIAQCHDVTVFAGGNCTADASIDAGSSDPDVGDTLTLSQSPASPYPIGDTVVTLTVTDNHGVSSQCVATVTVVDNTPPVISNCPTDQTVNATSPAGAVVTFETPTATDNCSAVVTCSIASGSTFPTGTTTVTCTATDGSGNTDATCRFTVKVKSADEQIRDLIDLVKSLPIAGSLKREWVHELEEALQRPRHACEVLNEFAGKVRNPGDRRLTVSQAAQLLSEVARIKAVLGCPDRANGSRRNDDGDDDDGGREDH